MGLARASLAATFGLFVAAAVLILLDELRRPDLLLVGNITVDLVDGTTPTGGAVSYAAVAAKALGARVCVVTVAGPEADLDVFEGARLNVLPAPETLTFEHTYTWWGHSRKLRVTANPNITVTRAHVPPLCRKARAVLLGPLTQHDLDASSFINHTGFWDRLLNRQQVIGLMAQGFQRSLAKDGSVLPLLKPSQQLLGGLAESVSVFLSDVETVTWPPGSIQAIAQTAARLVITKGDKGADEFTAAGSREIPPTKVGKAVDTNGAGDTFATVYMMALMRGDPDPGATASWAASRAVLQPQLCKPHCAAALIPEGVAPITDWQRLNMALQPLLGRLGGVVGPQALLRMGWMQALGQLVAGVTGAPAESGSRQEL